MTTTNVPSDQFEDLKRDVEDATRYSNSTTPYTNRVGQQIRPIPLQAQDIADNITASEQALANSGFIPKGDFTAGGTVEAKNEVFSDGTDYWRYDGALPLTVTAGSSPTPTGVGAWINVSDGALRSQLAAVDSTVLVGGVEARHVAQRAYVDIRQFGADGTEANDTAALAAMAAQGVNAEIPTGVFKITPNTVVATSGWSIRGTGARSILELQSFGKLIEGDSVVDVSFHNVHLSVVDGLVPTDRSASKTFSLYFTNSNTITVQGCFVSKNLGSQIYLEGCRGCVIDGNTLFAGGVTLPAPDPSSSRDYYPDSGADITFYGSDVSSPQGQFGKSVISNNLCFSNKDIGIEANQLGGDGRITITGNVVATLQDDFVDWVDAATLNRRHGIIIGYNGSQGETDASGNGIVVTGNSISNTLWTGVYSQDNVRTVNKRGYVIANNHMFKIGRATEYYGNLLGAIFLFSAANGTVVSNNVIEDFQGVGAGLGAIRVIGTTGAGSELIVNSNIINKCASQAIKLGAEQTNAIISKNIITRCQEDAIVVDGTSSVFLIEGNKIEVSENKRGISAPDGLGTLKVSSNYLNYTSATPSTEGAIYVRRLGTEYEKISIDNNTIEGAFFSGVDALESLEAGKNWWPIKDNLFKDCLSAFEGLSFANRCFVFNNRYENTPKHTNSVIANRIYDSTLMGDNVSFKAPKADVDAWSASLWQAAAGDCVHFTTGVASGTVGAVFSGSAWVNF